MKPARSFWKKARLILLLLLIIGIAIQFIRPRLDNPPVTGDLQAPAEVKAILQRACYDCHSNQTRLAWFDQPAPAYWLVASDVKRGREVLNFSNWSSLPKAQQAGKLFESIFQVEQKAMPLKQYTLLHHGGNISPEEVAVLKRYALTLAYAPRPDTARQRALLDQYEKWMKAAPAPAEVKPEHNGIGYADLARFSSWRAISTTERYDNGTLRLILGNAVAVRAIHEGHTNPWPDGAAFAKVAWDQLPDTSGEIHAGAFRQVEFMIRDTKKYDASFGWGFARWVGGLAMKPYGKDESFVTECMNCHQPLKKNNYTFTFPVADTLSLYDQAASLPDTVASHPLTGAVITSFVNRKEGTMSTLYGNAAAVESARSGHFYSTGAVVSLVTWSQREDPHWFGGRIPNEVRSIEVIYFPPSGSLLSSSSTDPPVYEYYEGPARAKKTRAEPEMQARLKYITALKASVMP
jgi:hypothetical protein